MDINSNLFTPIPANSIIYGYADKQHTFFNWNTVIVVIIIVLLIIVIIWAILQAKNWYKPSEFGEWGPVIIGQCQTDNGLCTEIGKQTTIQQVFSCSATTPYNIQ